jgi:hypothetical protein
MFVLRCRCIFVGQVKLYLGFFFSRLFSQPSHTL